MHRTLTLSEYVKKRNGVALGASHSMRNMLSRSLGAMSFAVFWHYWNPIWGYYLSCYVMRPLRSFLPLSLATLITFMVSGALHDLAVSLVKWHAVIFFTPWFGVMGLVVIGSSKIGISYGHFAWYIRAFINVFIIVGTLSFTYFMAGIYA
ncbi:MAG: hypothetical protein ACK4NN_11585 [Rheinheimera sp.]